MYNVVRRFGKVQYDTLRLPHKVVAQEDDGSMKFKQGDGSLTCLTRIFTSMAEFRCKGLMGFCSHQRRRPSSEVSNDSWKGNDDVIPLIFFFFFRFFLFYFISE